jgi:hypothetical protein
MSRRSVDTREQQVGQEQSYDIPAFGPAGHPELEIEVCDTPNWKDKAKNLAFMEEVVQVHIPITGAPNEELFIDVSNGGVKQFIERGRWQNVKRKFIEVLARAKAMRVTTPKYTDSEGNDSTRLVQTPALKYPFEMRDKNPNGPVWLQRVLAEA